MSSLIFTEVVRASITQAYGLKFYFSLEISVTGQSEHESRVTSLNPRVTTSNSQV